MLAALALAGCSDLRDAAGLSGDTSRGRVVRVVDGDTLKVRVAGRGDTVRVIGIDTPETVRPGTPVECGGRAASRNLRRLAVTRAGRGRTVRLTTDPTQDERDRYDRLLAYVEVPGAPDRDLGLEQVRAGWARAYVYGGVPFRRAQRYLAAQDEARAAGRGAWGSCPGGP